MSNDQTMEICGKSLGLGWWCVKSGGHAPPCSDADVDGITVCNSCSGYEIPTDPTCRPDLAPRGTVRFTPCRDCGKPPTDFGIRVFDRRVVPTIEALETKVAAMGIELEALRAVENAALAYVPYPAKTFDERHAPTRAALIHALANVVKVRGDAAKGKGR